jgi:hypothetical protein
MDWSCGSSGEALSSNPSSPPRPKKIVKDTVEMNKIQSKAGCQWLAPIILFAWEAEIRRIVVQGQPGAKKE